MESMTSSPAIGVSFHRQRRWLLPFVWLTAGLFAAAALAQPATPPANTEPSATEPATAVPSGTGPATNGATVTTDAAADAGAAEPPPAETAVPAEPVAAETAVSAVTANERLVASNEQQFGKNSLPTAEAYFDLAEAQRHVREYEAAAKNYLAAIEIYRAVDGAFTSLAINPLTSLGDNYHESGDNLSAVSAYTEARTVSRRVFGLLSERQIVLLDRMSRSLLDLNQSMEADAQQVEALRLMERNYPPESDQVLAGIYKYASWLRDRGQFQLERDQYTRALRIIREHYGKENVRQVEPLVGIGNSFRNQRIPDGQGIGALQDALTLLLAAPEHDPLSTAVVLRDLGDWAVAFNKVGYDGTEYRRAWELLGEVANGEQLRGEWFTGPTYVLREPISLRGLSEEQDAPRGHVLVSFDLDRTGQSGNVAVVESEPPGLKDEAVLRHIRRSRFRPQLAGGELINASALALQFNFRYSLDAVVEQAEESQR